jgi:hypothetical protein
MVTDNQTFIRRPYHFYIKEKGSSIIIILNPLYVHN